MAAVQKGNSTSQASTAKLHVARSEDVTALYSICDHGKGTAGKSWQQADGSFRVCASDSTTLEDIAGVTIRAIKKGLKPMNQENDVREEHAAVQLSKSALLASSHSWIKQPRLDKQPQCANLIHTWGVQVVAVTEPVLATISTEGASAKLASDMACETHPAAVESTQPSTLSPPQLLTVPVLITCNLAPWGPTFSVQQGLLRVPWDQFGLEATSATATDTEGIGMLSLNIAQGANAQLPNNRRSMMNAGDDSNPQKWRLATIVLHFAACGEPQEAVDRQEDDTSCAHTQGNGCMLTQRAIAKNSTSRKLKQLQPPAKVAAALVHEAVTAILVKMKRETGGDFGTTPVEAKANHLLPKLATCITSIIRSANNPVLMPYACNALGCVPDSLHDVLHSNLKDACLNWGVNKVHQRLKSKGSQEKLAVQMNTGTADQHEQTMDGDCLGSTQTFDSVDASNDAVARLSGRPIATGTLSETEDQEASMISESQQCELSRSSYASTGRPATRQGKRASQAHAVAPPGSLDLSTAVHQVFGIKPLKRVCASYTDELDLLF